MCVVIWSQAGLGCSYRLLCGFDHSEYRKRRLWCCVCVTDILFWAPWRRRSVWSWPTFLLYSIPAELFIPMAQGYRSNSDHLSPHKCTHRHFMLTHIVCTHLLPSHSFFSFVFFYYNFPSLACGEHSHPPTRREIHTPSGVQWGWAVFF